MADTVNATLGLIGCASVSMTTTIWAVWRETLWKDSVMALMLLAFASAEAWWWESEEDVPALGKAFSGEECGVMDVDSGVLGVSHIWFGNTFFR